MNGYNNYGRNNNNNRPNNVVNNNGGNQYFVNPYTFIPIDNNAPERRQQEYGNLSGVINCSIEIRTPTFIPNTTKTFDYPGQEGHKRKVFYSYDDLSGRGFSNDLRNPQNPVIPGSEIRGMVRNVYEQLTNSCLLHVDEFNLPYKRTNEPKKRCLLAWDNNQGVWKLYKGNEDHNNEFEFYSGSIEFDSKNNTYFLNEDGWEGDYHITEDYARVVSLFDYGKKNKVMFYDNNDIEPYSTGDSYYWLHIPPLMKGRSQTTGKPTANKAIVYSDNNLTGGVVVSAQNIKRFEKVLGIIENVKGGYLSDVNQNSNSKKIYKNYVNHYKNHEPLIVYVDKDSYDRHFRNDVIYMSPASMTKEFFENTIDKLLERNAQHQPCDEKDSVCPACRLFGMVGSDGATCGKLKFSDAEKTGPVEYGNEITLAILGSPKISSTEFYLQRPLNAPIWNYDYYITYTRDGNEWRFNRHSYDAQLMGRKVYWNRNPQTGDAQPTKMNCSVTPIKRGTFSFYIHFDKLTEAELNKLLFCLKLDGQSYHKIGGAKPLGFGQIRVSVESVETTNYSVENGLIVKESSDYTCSQADYNNILESQAAQNVIKYSKDLPQDLKSTIDYPKEPESPDIFKWFGDNRGSVRKPEISRVLPKITDAIERQRLPKIPNTDSH